MNNFLFQQKQRLTPIIGRLAVTGAIAMVMQLGSSPTLQAAQVTFLFDAEVTEINDPDDVAAALPFEPILGQHISGKVTFTPVPFGQSSAPDGSLEIELGGESFAAKDLPIVSLNNVSGMAGFNPFGPDDSITISCDGLSGCVNTESSVPEVSLSYLGLGIGSHNLDVVDGGTVIDTPEVWNSLPIRRLVFKLSTSTSDSPITITADVGQMLPIPEPSSWLLLGALLTTLALAHRQVH